MKFSMIGQEKGDLFIQVTTWAGLTTIFLYVSILNERTVLPKTKW